MSEDCTGDRTDPALLETVEVVSNERVTQGVGLLILRAERVAARVRPGQFVHLRVDTGRDFLLRRPFSVHRAGGELIELLYQVLGTGTRAMSLLEPGHTCDVIGPLGTGWCIAEDISHALLVSGGLGAAPLGMLAEHLAERGVAVTAAMGAPTASRLVGRGVIEESSRLLETATDDGSQGVHGLVTALTSRQLTEHDFDIVYCCGPEPMQRAVAAQAASAGVRCQVSLERLMACGIGACLSCVVTTTDGLKRACVDGPVFEAAHVVWDPSEIPPRH